MLGASAIIVFVCVSLLLLNCMIYLLCHSKLLDLLKTILSSPLLKRIPSILNKHSINVYNNDCAYN